MLPARPPISWWLAALAIALANAGAAAVAMAAGDNAVARGAYLFRAAGGCACHTASGPDAAFLAGGRALKTPFGTFYAPNITPDPETGIGGWNDADFIRAMREGRRPDGAHYYPVFPYPAFTLIRDADLGDLKAYLDSVPPVRRPNRKHDLSVPYGWRFLLWVWKWLDFTPGPLATDPSRSATWNRGAYLARALGHCDQCHTPRGPLGGLDRDLGYAGTRDGPGGEIVPNITPDPSTGIGDWGVDDIATLLETGMKPDFDDVQGLMDEAIAQGYRYLSDADRVAIAVYIHDLPPIVHRVARATAKSGGFD